MKRATINRVAYGIGYIGVAVLAIAVGVFIGILVVRGTIGIPQAALFLVAVLAIDYALRAKGWKDRLFAVVVVGGNLWFALVAPTQYVVVMVIAKGLSELASDGRQS